MNPKFFYAKRNTAWIVGEEIYVDARFSQAFLQDCRAIEGRRWIADKKVNAFPLSSTPMVKALASKYNISLPAELNKVDDGKHFSDSGERYNVTLEGDEIVIRFDYNPSMIEAVRMFIPSVRWDGKNKVWRCPIKNSPDALKFAVENRLRMSEELVDRASEVMEQSIALLNASQAIDADVEIPGIAIPLLPYQRAGVSYMKRVRRGIIGDQPGLGKTAQAIATVASEGQFPMVVVCPNTLKLNWQREIKKFFPKLTVSVLSGKTSQKIEPSDVIIVNYDICLERNTDIFEHGYRSLVVDESHAIKNGQKKHGCPSCGASLRANSKMCYACNTACERPLEIWTVRRTAAVMQLAKALPPENFVLLLTGTPITNRPDELIPQLEAVGRLDAFGGPWRFKNRYAPKRNIARNTTELNLKLRELCFVRRRKEDVFDELPELRNAVQYLEVSKTNMKEYQRVEVDVVEYFAQRAQALAEEEGSDGTDAYWQKRIRLEAAQSLVKITGLRDVVSKIKYDAAIEWIDNFLEAGDGEKVIIFAEHIDFVERLYDRYKKIAVKIRGGVSVDDRQKAVESFQNDPSVRLFIANMTSASEGLTLTAASDVIFCELGWTPALHEQCVSRCYARANDMHGATAWYLLVSGTIDETMYDLLEKKKVVVDAVTDGKEVEGGSVMDGLVRELTERGRK